MNKDKLVEIALCMFCLGVITWFVVGSGLYKLVIYMIQGKI